MFDRIKAWVKQPKHDKEIPPTGIKILNDPADPVLDIVFVHGLNGHQVDTWRAEGQFKCWPETLLPRDIGNARIMAYGYDAAVVNMKQFLGKVSVNKLKQHAENLLQTLALYRSEVESHVRPIFFVCHSLGGIVCKYALVRSKQWGSEQHLHTLYGCTRAIIFLGTPHKGAGLAGWFSRLAQVVGIVKQTNPQLLKQLEANSADLERIQEEFDILLRSRAASDHPALQIQCFFEERPVTGVGTIVNYQSATLAGNVPIGIHSDHRNMTKFGKSEETGYILVTRTLLRFLRSLTSIQGNQPSSIDVFTARPGLSRPVNATSTMNAEGSMHTGTSEVRTPSPASSSGSSGFVKLPPGGRFIVNEKVIPLPIKMVPTWFETKKKEYFQSRGKEILQIKSSLLDSRPLDASTPEHRSFLIVGMGGVGKSQLAVRFASLYGAEFDALFWLTADSEARLTENYSNIAAELGLVGPSDSMTREHSCETFRTWLGDPVRGAPQSEETKTLVRWLLVFDNAEHPETIKKFWPPGSHGSILVTTRNPRLNNNDRPYTGKLSLSGLETADAALLLRHLADDEKPNDTQTEADAMDIVEWCQGVPLAIEQLGRAIYDDELTISGFKKLFPYKNALYAYLHGEKKDGPNLVTSWALDRLYKSQPDTFVLLSLVSMLDPEGVENRTLEPRQNTLNSSGSLMTQSEFRGYRNRLSKTSLIHVNRDNQEVRVHRLVQDVTIEVAVRYGLAATVFRQAVSRIAHQWPFLNRKYVTGKATLVNRWDECRLAYIHILRLMEVHAELKQLSVAELASFELAELLLEAVQYRLETGLGHEAIPLLDTVKSIYRPEHSCPSASAEDLAKYFRGRIGLAVSARNIRELLTYARKAWDIEVERHRKAGNTTSSILAVAYNDLGQAWACHREWDRALDLLKESRRIRELLPDFSRDKLFSPLYHKALVLQHQGNYDEAEDVVNEAIQDREATFGVDDASSVRSAALFYARGNIRLARADESRRDINHSLHDHMEAVSRAVRAAGQKNRSTLLCQYQLARVYAKRAEYTSACQQLEEIQSHLINKPTYYADIARSSYLYATSLKALGKDREAKEELRRSVDVHNTLRPLEQRTMATITPEDIAELVPYDYL